MLGRSVSRLTISVLHRHGCRDNYHRATTQLLHIAQTTPGTTCFVRASSGGNTTGNKKAATGKKAAGVASVPENAGTAAKENTQQEARQIQKMPANLTKLISDTREEGWPPLTSLTVFVMKCSGARVSLEQIENYLISYFRSKSKSSEKAGNRETNFYSRHLLENWRNNHHYKHVQDFIKYFNTNIIMKNKDKIPLKRLEYSLAVWRLLFLVESCLESGNQEESLQLIEEFCSACARDHGDSTPRLAFILAKLQLSKEKFAVPEEMVQQLGDYLEAVVPGFAPTANPGMPSTLQLNNINRAFTNLLDGDIPPVTRSSLLLSQAMCSWKTANFSTSLETLSEASRIFLESHSTNFTPEQERLYCALCVHFCQVWSGIALSSTKQIMEPALLYLVTQCQLFSKHSSNIGLLPAYVLLISLRGQKDMKEFSDKLEVLLPQELRWEKFERCFLVDGMTKETRTFFITDYVKRLIIEKSPTSQTIRVDNLTDRQPSAVAHQLEASQEPVEGPQGPVEGPEGPVEGFQGPANGPSEAGKVQSLSWGPIQQELLDISVLEAVTSGVVTDLLDLLLNEARAGHLPGLEATEAVVTSLSETKDIDSLNLLYRGMPYSCHHRERFYLESAKISLANLMGEWEQNRHLKAWILLVELYRSVLSDKSEARILLTTGEELIRKCRVYSKLFIEEAATKMGQLKPAIKAAGIKVAAEHRDTYILLAHWESLFFGDRFEDEEEANSLLEEFPQLVKYLDINLVLSRAERYNREDNFRKLMEVVLRHESSAYHKSRAFEGLLGHQIKRGNISAAEQTVKTAKGLNIRITADFLQDFLALREEMLDYSKKSSILYKMKNIFSRNKQDDGK